MKSRHSVLPGWKTIGETGHRVGKRRKTLKAAGDSGRSEEEGGRMNGRRRGVKKKEGEIENGGGGGW